MAATTRVALDSRRIAIDSRRLRRIVRVTCDAIRRNFPRENADFLLVDAMPPFATVVCTATGLCDKVAAVFNVDQLLERLKTPFIVMGSPIMQSLNSSSLEV
jgi:hypothetical protein